MIPFGLFQAFILTESEQLEVRALELSPTSFTVRLVFEHQRLIPDIKGIQVRFYSLLNHRDSFFNLADYSMVHRSNEADASIYTVEHYAESYEVFTQDSRFSECVKALTSEYLTYVKSKTSLFPEEISHIRYPEYPSDQEEVMCSTWEEQKRYWGDAYLDHTCKVPDSVESNLTLGIQIRYATEIEVFLRTTPDEYLRSKFADYGMPDNPLADAKPGCISFGDACCPLLFPDSRYYAQMIQHCQAHNQKLLFQLAPVSESLLDTMCERIRILDQMLVDKECTADIEVGDIGMLRFCESLKGFGRVSKGILLCKKKKDTRLKYVSGGSEPMNEGSNEAMNEGSSESKDEVGIPPINEGRYDYPKDKDLALLDETEDHVYLPYYQTNTGTFCTLRALTDSGDRSKQTRILTCNQKCGKQRILYPKHLNMVGIGNSLYGFQLESMARGYKKIKKRIILNI